MKATGFLSGFAHSWGTICMKNPLLWHSSGLNSVILMPTGNSLLMVSREMVMGVHCLSVL